MCNYKLEKASPNHRKFILDCILEASKSGHFNPIFYQQKNNKQMISGLELQIYLTLNSENMPTSNGNFVSSKLYVYLQNGNPCAMSWIQGEEIYLFYVDKQARRKGIGKAFLKELLQTLFLTKSDVFIRVYIGKSKIFENLAIKHGFIRSINQNATQTIKYDLSRDKYDDNKKYGLFSKIQNFLCREFKK